MVVQSAASKIWYLKRVNLFKGISKEEMEQMAKMVEEKTFRKKELIYLPGEPGRHVYLLKKGVVKISKTTPDGRELTLAFLKPGEIFGELEAVGETTRDTQAEAHSDLLICVLRRENLLKMVEMKPQLGIQLSKLIGFRRQVIENRLENLIFRTVPQRLASLLLELGREFGEPSGNTTKITLPLTHQDLANLIGSARPTLTDALNDFKARGFVEVSGKTIIVKNLDALSPFPHKSTSLK